MKNRFGHPRYGSDVVVEPLDDDGELPISYEGGDGTAYLTAEDLDELIALLKKRRAEIKEATR